MFLFTSQNFIFCCLSFFLKNKCIKLTIRIFQVLQFGPLLEIKHNFLRTINNPCIALLCNYYHFWHKRGKFQIFNFLIFHPILMQFLCKMIRSSFCKKNALKLDHHFAKQTALKLDEKSKSWNFNISPFYVKNGNSYIII